MKRIYNWLAQPANRNLTVADIIASKGKKKLTQVKVNSAEEAYACGKAKIDMIVCAAKEVEMIREGNDEIFLTGSKTQSFALGCFRSATYTQAILGP